MLVIQSSYVLDATVYIIPRLFYEGTCGSAIGIISIATSSYIGGASSTTGGISFKIRGASSEIGQASRFGIVIVIAGVVVDACVMVESIG